MSDLAAAPSPRISAVVPVFNEGESLPHFLPELIDSLARTALPYEILLVDDGSTDGSDLWIRGASRRLPHVRGVLLDRHEGQSGALAAGLERARGEVVVTLDADGQNDPADLPRLLAALDGADVVSGVRQRRADDAGRRISSAIANGVRRAVIGDRVTDIGCSLKAYRREALVGLPHFRGLHRFLPALCQMRGARVVEIPVNHRPRRFGRSKYGIGDRLVAGLWDLIGVRWLRSRMLRARVREVTDD